MRVTEVDPESCKELWAAVLEDALHLIKRLGEPAMPRSDWGRNTSYDRKLAADWLRSLDIDVGSFRWVCEQFNLDPDVVVERVFGRKAA